MNYRMCQRQLNARATFLFTFLLLFIIFFAIADDATRDKAQVKEEAIPTSDTKISPVNSNNGNNEQIMKPRKAALLVEEPKVASDKRKEEEKHFSEGK